MDAEADLYALMVDRAAIVLRSEHELYDRVASKCTSDATLDAMLRQHPDPFQAFAAAGTGVVNGERLFSVLPPLKLLRTGAAESTASSKPSSAGGSPDRPDHSPEPETPRATRTRRDLSTIDEAPASVAGLAPSEVEAEASGYESDGEAATDDLPGGLGR